MTEDVLRPRPQLETSGRRICHRAIGFHRYRSDALVAEDTFHNYVGSAEDIGIRHRVVAKHDVRTQLGEQQRAVVIHGVMNIDDGGERFDICPHELGRINRLSGGLCDHDGHDLSCKPHDAACDGRTGGFPRQIRHRWRLGVAGQVRCGVHTHHAW